MKTKLKLTVLILLIASNFSNTQTPEQQKQMEEAIRMQDSIMNLPQYKDMMQQMKDMQDMQQAQKNMPKQKTVQNKSVQKKPSNDDWYWEKTIASTNNKFKNWTAGTADIVIAYKGPGLTVFKIGTINEDGNVVFNLPDNFKTQISLEQQIGPQGMFFDIYDNALVNYTNKDTGFITNTSLLVMRADKQIGTLTIGNSVRVTKNLTTQSGVDSGDEGYILYWAYANEKCGINLNQNWNGEVRKDGTKTRTIQTTVNYNLNFKPGWNLIKTEVIGKYQLEHERGLDKSWFKSHRHSVIEGIPKNITYFFRKTPY